MVLTLKSRYLCIIQRVTKSSADRPGKFSKSIKVCSERIILIGANYFKIHISTIKTNANRYSHNKCFDRLSLHGHQQ